MKQTYFTWKQKHNNANEKIKIKKKGEYKKTNINDCIKTIKTHKVRNLIESFYTYKTKSARSKDNTITNETFNRSSQGKIVFARD